MLNVRFSCALHLKSPSIDMHHTIRLTTLAAAISMTGLAQGQKIISTPRSCSSNNSQPEIQQPAIERGVARPSEQPWVRVEGNRSPSVWRCVWHRARAGPSRQPAPRDNRLFRRHHPERRVLFVNE